MGGGQDAINVEKAWELKQQVEICCGGPVACIALYACCDYSAACVDGRCTLVRCGDLDGSGDFTVSDALMALRSTTSNQLCLPPDPYCNLGDVDCSGRVSAADALILLRCAVGLPCELCCEG
jgi:hypothetical protein